MYSTSSSFRYLCRSRFGLKVICTHNFFDTCLKSHCHPEYGYTFKIKLVFFMHASQVDLGSWQAVIGHTRQSYHGLNGWVIKDSETTLTLTKMKLLSHCVTGIYKCICISTTLTLLQEKSFEYAPGTSYPEKEPVTNPTPTDSNTHGRTISCVRPNSKASGWPGMVTDSVRGNS